MLRAENCDHTFELVGTTTNSIVTGNVRRSDIRFIDTRHERGAAFMAYGYARASGKPAALPPQVRNYQPDHRDLPGIQR